MGDNKIYRSTKNKMLGGVCGGLAEHYGWDPTMVRAAFVLLTLFGPGLLLYIILWLLFPANPGGPATQSPAQPQ